MPTNFYMFFVAGLIPLLIGAVYYHPRVLGSAWMRASGVTEARIRTGNMALIFGMVYVASVVLSFFLSGIVIHQGAAAQSMFPEAMEVGSEAHADLVAYTAAYGDRFRTFGHGFMHGLLTAVFFVLPIIAIIALFERRSSRYTFIHFGYWAITLGLVGGLLCATLEYAVPG